MPGICLAYGSSSLIQGYGRKNTAGGGEENGMEVVENLYAGYGDGPPRGEGVYQAMAIARGQEYFEEEFPELDRITTATILEGTSPKPN